MSLVRVVEEILNLDHRTAVFELAQLKQNITATDYRTVIKLLSKAQEARLIQINDSEVNRRRLTSYKGFTVGGRVLTEVYNSLIGVELTVFEFVEPWVCCLLPSGSYSPGLLFSDLKHLDSKLDPRSS
jgi:hypothetical protein